MVPWILEKSDYYNEISWRTPQICYHLIHKLIRTYLGEKDPTKIPTGTITSLRMTEMRGWRSVQSLSCVQFFATPWTAACWHAELPGPSPTPGACSNSSPSTQWCHPTISPCHPLLLPLSIFLSFKVFSNESVIHIRWQKYWSFSLSISPSNAYSGLISFRIDWFDLAVQGTLNSLLQYHSSKASILQCSAIFMVQLSHPYMTTGKKHNFD